MLFVIPHFSDSYMKIINFSHSLTEVITEKYITVQKWLKFYFRGIPSTYFVKYLQDLIP